MADTSATVELLSDFIRLLRQETDLLVEKLLLVKFDLLRCCLDVKPTSLLHQLENQVENFLADLRTQLHLFSSRLLTHTSPAPPDYTTDSSSLPCYSDEPDAFDCVEAKLEQPEDFAPCVYAAPVVSSLEISPPDVPKTNNLQTSCPTLSALISQPCMSEDLPRSPSPNPDQPSRQQNGHEKQYPYLRRLLESSEMPLRGSSQDTEDPPLLVVPKAEDMEEDILLVENWVSPGCPSQAAEDDWSNREPRRSKRTRVAHVPVHEVMDSSESRR